MEEIETKRQNIAFSEISVLELLCTLKRLNSEKENSTRIYNHVQTTHTRYEWFAILSVKNRC